MTGPLVSFGLNNVCLHGFKLAHLGVGQGGQRHSCCGAVLGDARPDEDYVLTKIAPADAREGVRVVGDAFIFDVQVYDRDTRQTTHWRIHARRAAFRETMVHRVCGVIDLDVNVCDILVSRVEDQIQHK